MYIGFPSAQVALLRCPDDNGTFTIADGENRDHIVDGALRCTVCRRQYPVTDGVLRLLEPDRLDQESAHEWRLRDERANQEYAHTLERPIDNELEMRPMLAALQPSPGGALLELGCGTGRYTMALTERCGALLAVDFSLGSLQILAQRLPSGAPVGLVHADITRLAVAPRRFQCCLSTLVSNLPAREHRLAMHRLAATALAEGGRFIFGVHHQDLRRRWRGIPQAGRYNEGGIYRYYFRRAEIASEVRPFFHLVRTQPVLVFLPLTERLGLPTPVLSLAAARVPLINELGRLLMVQAEQPIRSPQGLAAKAAS